MGPPIRSTLEAMYAPEPDDEAWQARILREVRPLLDDGSGVQSFRIDLAAERPVSDPMLVGGTTEWQAVWREHWWRDVMLAVPHDTVRAIVSFSSVSTTHQLFSAVAAKITSFAELLERLDDEGYQHALARRAPSADKLFYPDSLNLVGLDASGSGVAIVANRRARFDGARVPRRSMLTAISAHLAAATRLRRRRRAASAPVEGVLSPTGKVLDATGEASTPSGRDALRRAALAMNAATRVASDEEALALWRALHAGRWTLVDQVESDGRRVLVARENRPPTTTRVAGLSQRERDVLAELAAGLSNKEIGYRLGIAPSTVATLLARAATKLGVESTTALIRRARELNAEPVR